MIALSLAEIAQIVGGEVHGDPTLVVSGAAYVDNRTPTDAGLFVAIAGERVDGHDYAAGSHAVLGSRPTAAPTVVVEDPVAALGLLARHVLDRLVAQGTTVLALTGSQGKTSTKDLLAHVLTTASDHGGPTVATTANNNNEIGVPLTVLRADPTTAYVVVEMGARGVGHIAYLCGVAPPSVAAVLNVGTAHIGEFGGQEAIATAKSEILTSLPADGTAVLNADDPLVAAMGSSTGAGIVTFGTVGDVAWRHVELDELGRPTFEIGHEGRWCPVSLSQSGAHHVANAGAATAMALAVGLSLSEVAAALSTAEASSRWRMEIERRADGLLVVNDSYNANPASMYAALEALAAIGGRRTGRTIAVLGEMLELGTGAEAAHREVGEAAAAAGVDVVVAVGDAAAAIADGMRGGHGEAILTAGRDEALSWVRKNARAEDAVLVKASRGAALEWLAERLVAEGGTAAP